MACEEQGGLVWKRMNGHRVGDDDDDDDGDEDENVGFSHEDVWDDSALIDAYDRAVQKLKEEIKAEEEEEEDGREARDKPTKSKQKKKRRKKAECPWEVGQKCLALFSENQLYYDAEILSINVELGLAYVRFDYYQNEEDVKLGDLLPIECKEELKPEFSEEVNEEYSCVDDDQYLNDSNTNIRTTRETNNTDKNNQSGHNWRVSDLCYVPDGRGGFAQAVLNSFVSSEICNITLIESGKRKKVNIDELRGKTKAKPSSNVPKSASQPNFMSKAFPMSFENYHQFAPSPMSFPSWSGTSSFMPSMVQQMRYSTPPPPPPPPPPLLAGEVVRGDEEALANMLMSWYMNGYHTGYYRGLQQRLDPMKKRNDED